MLKESDLNILLFRSKFLKQKDYWIKKLTGEKDTTDIQPIYAQGQTRDIQWSEVEIHLPGELAERILKMGKGAGLAVYIFLLTAIKSMIYRYTANENIAIVSPVNQSKINEDTINNQVLISDLMDPAKSFKEMILEVRRSVLEAYENQDYPFDKILEFISGTENKYGIEAVTRVVCSLDGLHSETFSPPAGTGLWFRFQALKNIISGKLLFDTNGYSKEEASRFCGHLISFLTQVIKDVNLEISRVSFLSQSEKNMLLKEFNNNKADFSKDKSVYHIIENHARTNPDTVSMVGDGIQLSYSQFNARSNKMVLKLKELGLQADRTVGILLPRSLDMAESIVAVWKAGGAYIPLDVDYPASRILGILEDSGTDILISYSYVIGAELPGAYDGKILNLDTVIFDGVEEVGNLDLNLDMNHLAYIIYTSGSTGKPKGAMVEHIGMMNHLASKVSELCLCENSIVAQNASHTFDISVWQFFVAQVTGGRTVIYSEDLVFEPDMFIGRVLSDQVTVLEVVPSYLSVMLEFLGINFRSFPGLEFLLVTGEAVKPGLITRWFESYPGIPVCNAYGPTEASDDITHFTMHSDPLMERVPIGKPIQNMTIYIVDPSMNICPLGVKGEILVSGVGVGRGYLNDDIRTAQVFTTDPFSESKDIRMYKTGDLGRWLSDGTIEFFGRKDYQVKIRGFRIELGEIESKLMTHPNIKEAIVVVKEESLTGKHLCAYLVTEDRLNVEEIKNHLFELVPDYMIPEFLIELAHLPLTANGKVDRNKLTQMDDSSMIKAEYVAPRNQLEIQLVEIWAKILGKDNQEIGIDENFFEIGGHSLNATIMVARVHKQINVKVPIGEVFKNPTVRAMSQFIGEAAEESFTAIEPIEDRLYYPLSAAQKRLYIQQQLEAGNVGYNLPYVLALQEGVNKQKIDRTFRQLITRHESLRTSFEMNGDQPVQRIHTVDDINFSVEYEESEIKDPMAILERFVRPFDLSQAPLLRVKLLKLGQVKYLMLVDMHHIITDGTSQNILTREFSLLYKGEELPPPILQYRDYSTWYNKQMESGAFQKQEDFWVREFSRPIPELKIPHDFERPATKSFAGDIVQIEIETDLTLQLKDLAKQEQATLFMVLLAGYNIFLAKLSGQDDIVVGTGVAGRGHAEIQQVIGMFVNTLPLRNYPVKTKIIREFLGEVREKTLLAFENQDYQLEDLVDKVMAQGESERKPLFDTVFVSQHMEVGKARAGEDTSGKPSGKLEAGTFGYLNRVAKFDLAFFYNEMGDKIVFTLEYSTTLFKKETIQRFVRYFKEILNKLPRQKDEKIEELTLSHDLLTTDIEDHHMELDF